MTGVLADLGRRGLVQVRRVACRGFQRLRAAARARRRRRRGPGGRGEAPNGLLGILLSRRADLDELSDVLARAAWYLGGPGAGTSGDAGGDDGPAEERIRVYLPPALVDVQVPEDLSPPGYLHDYLDRLPGVELVPRARIRAEEPRVLVVTRAADLLSAPVLARLGRVRVVDESFFSGVAAAEWARLAGEVGPRATTDLAELSRRNFRGLLERSAACERALVLGTGPSVDEVLEHDVDDAAGIVCNSIVKSDALLEHVRPLAICFGDPVFHFGPSEYAARFRDDLLDAAEASEAYLVTHRREARLLLRHHPELEDRLIGLEASADRWHVPRPEALVVRPTQNVLTLFMLPVAAAAAPRIEIGGCDGREPDESYFWQHNPRVQYTGLMRAAFEAHPSFFRDRLFADYYEQHCRQLEEQIRALEASGAAVENVTSSFIPALARRTPASRAVA